MGGKFGEGSHLWEIGEAEREHQRLRRLPRAKARELVDQAMEDLEQLENLEAESPLARLTARAMIANAYATLAVEIAIRDQTRRLDADLRRPDLH